MLSLLNLNRKENREEIYTVTKITGEQFRDVDSNASTDQILHDGGQAIIRLFEKSVAYSKPLVDAAVYKKMSKAEKAEHCTLNVVNTYVVVGDVGAAEVKLDELREQVRVYKVNAVEPHLSGSILVRHIKVLAK